MSERTSRQDATAQTAGGHHHDAGDHAGDAGEPPVMDRAFWEERYGSKPMIWSGNPNPHVVSDVAGLPAGTALDVGAGEGADAIWLAEQGWQVTAVDISETALARGRQRAATTGVAERITWQHADVTDWAPEPGCFDLVSVQFLHLPSAQRRMVYARLAAAVAAGGTLLVVGHHPTDMDAGVGRPRWPDMYFTAEELATELGEGWDVRAAESRGRTMTTPDGEVHATADAVLVAVRR